MLLRDDTKNGCVALHGFFNFWLGPVNENPSTISKVTMFENDLLKLTMTYIVLQSRVILQTFMWWSNFCAPTIQTSLKFRDFME